jgi:hypothetical protein
MCYHGSTRSSIRAGIPHSIRKGGEIMAEANERARRRHVIRVMCHLGDMATTWETGPGVETDEEAQAAIREAERIFREARQRGDTAFLVEPGQAPTRLETWDDRAKEAPEIIITPRLVGG